MSFSACMGGIERGEESKMHAEDMRGRVKGEEGEKGENDDEMRENKLVNLTRTDEKHSIGVVFSYG